MAITSTVLLTLAVFVGLGIYKFILEPAFLSPLAKIPNAHWSASLSELWILNERRNRRETWAVHEAHKKQGPIIRLAPNEISVNSVDGGIRTVYSGGYEKGNWYRNIFNNYNVEPMFAMPRHAEHSKRKRMLSNIYAKSTLQSSPAIAKMCHVMLKERLIPQLQRRAQTGEAIEVYTVFCAITLDFVSSYVFGLKNGSNYVEESAMGRKFFMDYKARQQYQFWPQECPRIVATLSSLGLRSLVVPSWVKKANAQIEGMIMSMCARAETDLLQLEEGGTEPKPEDWPSVYSQLRQAIYKGEAKEAKDAVLSIHSVAEKNKYAIASEMLDHILAGFDTSSIILTFLAWELSRPENAVWQRRLLGELRPLKGRLDAKEVDGLPILHAILMETLRIHAAIPGNQPRITPTSATLGAPGHTVDGLPANVRVQAQAWSLHREPSVFPDPEIWDPTRWLDASPEQLKEMGRWFWAFGSGGRMCVGSNLAMLDMKAIIAAIWSEFHTEVVNGDGMVHAGTYVAEPMGKDGKYCTLRLERVK